MGVETLNADLIKFERKNIYSKIWYLLIVIWKQIILTRYNFYPGHYKKMYSYIKIVPFVFNELKEKGM